MAEMKKKTKRQVYNELLQLPSIQDNAEYVAFINHELELLNKKNASAQGGEKKLTPTQQANEKIKAEILKEMSANPNKIYSCGDVQNFLQPLFETITMTNQKVSRLLNDMAKENLLMRVVEKRKAYFQIAKAEAVEG